MSGFACRLIGISQSEARERYRASTNKATGFGGMKLFFYPTDFGLWFISVIALFLKDQGEHTSHTGPVKLKDQQPLGINRRVAHGSRDIMPITTLEIWCFTQGTVPTH